MYYPVMQLTVVTARFICVGWGIITWCMVGSSWPLINLQALKRMRKGAYLPLPDNSKIPKYETND